MSIKEIWKVCKDKRKGLLPWEASFIDSISYRVEQELGLSDVQEKFLRAVYEKVITDNTVN